MKKSRGVLCSNMYYVVLSNLNEVRALDGMVAPGDHYELTQ